MSNAFKITETENKGLKRGYDIVVDGDYIEKKVDAELVEIGKQVKIPGFRPGKVPVAVLKQRYRKNTLGDVLNKTVDDALQETMKQYDVMPALRPDVKIDDYKDNESLKLTVSFDIMPESPEVAYDDITIEKPLIVIEDEEVDSSLERLAQNKRDTKDRAKSAKAKDGDIVVMDFTGYLGDELFDGGAGKDFSLELGSGQFIPGFEEQLVGCKAGDEKDVMVTFPEAYHSDELAGKEARFAVVVHKVQELVSPEMNDEMASAFGHDTLDSLKGFIKEQLVKEYEGVQRNHLKKQLFDILETKCEFDVPQAMLDHEFEVIWKQAEQEAERSGEATTDEQKDEYKTIAKRRVQLGIMLSQIAGRNTLEVSQQDMQEAIFAQARNYPGQERQVIEFFQKNPQQMQELRGPILEEKAVDFILDKITVKDSKRTLKEWIEAEAAEEEAAKSAKKPAAKKTPAKKAATKKSDDAKKDASDTASKKAPAKKPAAKKKAATTAKKTDDKKPAKKTAAKPTAKKESA